MGNLRVLFSKEELQELRAGRTNTLTVWKEGTFEGGPEVMRKHGVMATIVEEPWPVDDASNETSEMSSLDEMAIELL